MHKTAVLLINLGTPDELSVKSVRRYLREFLSDPRVIDIPKVWRWLLVNLLIVPFRAPKTTKAYEKIWQTNGSPLDLHTAAISKQLAEVLPANYQVEYAMRYGNPAIKDVLAKFKDHQSLIVIPLFPQYSSAANGSAIEKLLSEIKQDWNVPSIKVIHDFYNDPGYIAAYAHVIRQELAQKNIDLVLFSYHGLPERHIDKSECKVSCTRVNACPSVDINNRYCYRAQCYETTDLIAKEINLPANKYSVAFQSRLGRTPWIRPYTDVVLSDLIQKGHKHLAVVSPSFVADCLETLEEINIRTREQWLTLGGHEFTFIPCINNSPLFVKALSNLIQQ